VYTKRTWCSDALVCTQAPAIRAKVPAQPGAEGQPVSSQRASAPLVYWSPSTPKLFVCKQAKVPGPQIHRVDHLVEATAIT
jgi:hypothetical protein